MSQNTATISSLIREHFDALATAQGFDVEWPNNRFVPQSGATWVQVSIQWDPSSGVIGRERTNGRLSAAIRTPAGTGTRRAHEIQTAIIDEFSRLQLDGPPVVTFVGADPQTVGDTGYGYYQINVSAPFYADEED